MSESREVWYTCLKERAVLAPVVDALEEVAMTAGKLGYFKMSSEPMRTDAARNNFARAFLRATERDGRKPLPTDTLVMLDNDHLHDRLTLPRLASQITDRDGGRGVVGALCMRRIAPYDALAFVRDADGVMRSVLPDNDSLIECAVLGHGAIAIARWVFDDLAALGIRFPLWKYTYEDIDRLPSEDMYFCRICEAARISLWCDGGLVAPHYSSRWITPDDTRDYLALNPSVGAGTINVAVNDPVDMEAIC